MLFLFPLLILYLIFLVLLLAFFFRSSSHSSVYYISYIALYLFLLFHLYSCLSLAFPCLISLSSVSCSPLQLFILHFLRFFILLLMSFLFLTLFFPFSFVHVFSSSSSTFSAVPCISSFIFIQLSSFSLSVLLPPPHFSLSVPPSCYFCVHLSRAWRRKKKKCFARAEEQLIGHAPRAFNDQTWRLADG